MLQGIKWFLAASVLVVCAGCDLLACGLTGATSQSLYLTMRDGTRIAVDVWLPSDRTEGESLPALVTATRYWRAYDIHAPCFVDDPVWEEADLITGRGYALVVIDARGTGASFGSRAYPFSEDEMADYGEVLDWVVEQSWCNGRLGVYGTSYLGNTAELMAALGRDAVKAVAPRFMNFDVYTDVMYPGGLFNEGFIRDWSATNETLDANDVCALQEIRGVACRIQRVMVSGVKPVDDDIDGAMLRDAVLEHAGNANVYDAASAVAYKDDLFNTVPVEKLSPYVYRDAVEASQAPYFAWASWLDAGTAQGALERFATYSNPQWVIIGPWSHGGGRDVDPFKPHDAEDAMSGDQQDEYVVGFFDAFLKKDDTPYPAREVSYFTLNERVWKNTSVWPPDGFTATGLYFGENGALSFDAPQDNGGADAYTVDFEASTGPENRWWQKGSGADYGNRAEADERLLVYTSDPLDQDYEITGHPEAVLYVSSSAPDGAFCVYIEDVAPDGVVTYITEGQLRALHRRVSDGGPPYVQFGPYHSFLSADAEPLIPGETATLSFALQPVSVLVEEGHRLRVAVAGHDQGTFARVPETGNPVIEVQRNPSFPSHVILPMKPR